ncbi:MAG TPA: chemotaxis protein CheB [Candidatus Binatia bacterium]|nr:chemotaxis protein CheB [Candidatus Binatia bacterium]
MINAERIARDVICIGMSAGGVEAIMRLVALFPQDLPAAVAFVIHRSPLHESNLPSLLNRRSRLPVSEPVDGEPVARGRIYAAPRDQHMLVDDGLIRLCRGAKEHRTRPAIDPLFRSAAATCGRRVVGVLLSGAGDDGVAGLIAIKAAAGVSLVQDPAEARHPTMPRTAIAEDDVDAVLTIESLARAIRALAAGEPFEPPARSEQRPLPGRGSCPGREVS